MPMMSDVLWFLDRVASLTEDVDTISPSQWAEENRYLPDSVTPMPGYYRYDVAPYLREIVDCFDRRSPVREISVMKGAQIGATVGVFENVIGYSMAVLKSAPMMLMTADAELAKLRMESYVTPMVQQSGLADLITSNDEISKRRDGKTAMKMEWVGGGFLQAYGARNASKLRSISIMILLEDENDGYPDIVGKDGCPAKLAEARTNGFEETRKIGRLSTPLIKGASKIEPAFLDGDQRYYYVPCKHCNEMQVLKFYAIDEETGQVWGLTWETENGRLIEDSVKYRCKHCGGFMTNSDKAWMFKRGEWRPHATPKRSNARSYHISGMYSPARMKSWVSCVQDYLECWDVHTNKPKDIGKAQQFYNNVLGKTWAMLGDRVKFQQVSAHRRNEYKLGEIPNDYAEEVTGSRIQLLTAAIDVHKTHVDVAVFGWAAGCNPFVIDYWIIKGDAENLDSDVWYSVRELIESKRYEDNNGRRYKVNITLIDAGYNNDLVTRFCGEYTNSVYPILGRDTPSNNQRIQEFGQFETQHGTIGYRVTVDIYKDRWATMLKRKWNGEGRQPVGMFNAPSDLPDKALKELTVEYKGEKRDTVTNKLLNGWHD